MKARELRELSSEELTSRIDETRKNLIELRFQLASRKLESTAKLRQARKSLARMLTIQQQQSKA